MDAFIIRETIKGCSISILAWVYSHPISNLLGINNNTVMAVFLSVCRFTSRTKLLVLGFTESTERYVA